jgi:hypothetical protein
VATKSPPQKGDTTITHRSCFGTGLAVFDEIGIMPYRDGAGKIYPVSSISICPGCPIYIDQMRQTRYTLRQLVDETASGEEQQFPKTQNHEDLFLFIKLKQIILTAYNGFI